MPGSAAPLCGGGEQGLTALHAWGLWLLKHHGPQSPLAPIFYPLPPPAFPDCGGPGWHENGQGWWRKREEEEEEGKEAPAAVRVLGEFAGFQNKAATWLLRSQWEHRDTSIYV